MTIDLLLRNDSEPVQQNIADRMAFILGMSVAERKAIVALVKKCYGFRSQFLHHGESFSDVQTLERFMMYSWVLFLRFIQSHRDFREKEEMLEVVENLKFSRGEDPNK